MKKIVATLIIALITMSPLIACDISLSIDKAKKKYKTGSEVVVKVKVAIIHRNCNLNTKNIQYKNQGVTILSGTDWKETSPGIFERKLKIKITEEQAKESSLTVFRTCDRDGGTATITFKL